MACSKEHKAMQDVFIWTKWWIVMLKRKVSLWDEKSIHLLLMLVSWQLLLWSQLEAVICREGLWIDSIQHVLSSQVYISTHSSLMLVFLAAAPPKSFWARFLCRKFVVLWFNWSSWLMPHRSSSAVTETNNDIWREQNILCYISRLQESQILPQN